MVGAWLWIPSPRNLASRLRRRLPIPGPDALQLCQVMPGFPSALFLVKVMMETLLRVRQLCVFFLRDTLNRSGRLWPAAALAAAAVMPAVDQCDVETAAQKRAICDLCRDDFTEGHGNKAPFN